MKRLLCLPLLLIGCSKESDIHVYKVPKAPGGAPPPATAQPHTDHADPGTAPQAPPVPAMGAPGQAMDPTMGAPASLALNWKDPSGWKRESGSGMRVAFYKLPGGVECTVISLGGAAGGDLPNVNRWRGQMGLPDIASLNGVATPVKTPLGQALLVDFEGAGPQAGRRMVAAMLNDGNTSWFFKMTGPSGAVTQAKPGLVQLLGSLTRA